MQLLLLFPFLAIIVPLTIAAGLRGDGGYDIVVNIDHGAEEPIEIRNYFSQLNKTFEKMSAMMKETTKKFWLSSVNVLVPSTWNLTSACTEKSGNYTRGDIWLSENVTSPSANNPILCELPGGHIDLPLDYFAEDDSDRHAKELLSLWARYRWGAWEELGHPESSQFFDAYYADFANKSALTSCSDLEIRGKFQTEEDKDCDPMLVEDKLACTFKPQETQTARSSLMNFQLAETINSFCNEDNHNKRAPNKQNLYCHHQSVNETIYNSYDFRQLNNEPIPETITEIFCTKHQEKPLLYILIDRGNGTMAPLSRYGLVLDILNELDGYQEPKPFAGIGVYPDRLVNDTRAMMELVDFQSFNFPVFKKGLTTTKEEIFPLKDFGDAIIHAASVIGAARPISGGIILIFKINSPSHVPLNFVTERRVETVLKENNIKLFAIEHLEGIDQPNLVTLAKNSGGSSTTITIDNESISELLSELRSVYESKESIPDEEVEDSVMHAYEAPVVGNTNYTITIIWPISKMRIELVSEQDNIVLNSTETNLFINDDKIIYPLTKTREYGEAKVGVFNRYVYFFEHKFEKKMLKKAAPNITFTYYSNTPNINSNLVVTAYNETFPELDVTVETTTINGTAMFLEVSPNREVPLAIYAHVKTKEGKLLSNARVLALLQHSNEMGFRRELKDDGKFLDVLGNDGIYTDNFVPGNPPKDGIYSLDILVEADNANEACQKGTTSLTEPTSEYTEGENTLEVPDSECLPDNFKQIFPLPSGLILVNASSYPQTVTQVRDFAVNLTTDEENYDGLKFIMSPSKVYIYVQQTTSTVYYILRATDSQFLYDYNTDQLPPMANDTKVIEEANFESSSTTSLLEFSLENAKENGSFYYGVVVKVEGAAVQNTHMSNVVMVQVKNARPQEDKSTTTDSTTAKASTQSSSSSTPITTTAQSVSDATENNGGSNEDANSGPWAKSVGGIITIVCAVFAVGSISLAFAYRHFVINRRGSRRPLVEAYSID